MVMTDGFRIEWIDTAKLKPAEYNPRKDLQPSDPEYIQIQKSINEFGLVDPLVVNSDMTVIGGHQRLKVLTGAGFEKVPCSIVTLDKTKEKALNIALNKISGEWDFPKLKDLIVELDTGGFDLDTVGWTPKELEEVFSIFTVPEIDSPVLRDGDRAPFQQMTFTLHDEQAEEVQAAIDTAKKNGGSASAVNENSNGNALAYICQRFNNG
jgi:hypothetical protein